MHSRISQGMHPLKSNIAKMKFGLNIDAVNPTIPPKAHSAQKHQQAKNNPKRNEWRYRYGFVEMEFLGQAYHHEVYSC
jgi:hypothetical protein